MCIRDRGNTGYKVSPGKYKVKVTYGKESETKEFEIKNDPRQTTSACLLYTSILRLLVIGLKLRLTYINGF